MRARPARAAAARGSPQHGLRRATGATEGAGSAPPTPARAPDRQQGSTRRRPRRPPIVRRADRRGRPARRHRYERGPTGVPLLERWGRRPALRRRRPATLPTRRRAAPGLVGPGSDRIRRSARSNCTASTTSSSSGRRAYPSCAAASRSPTRRRSLETWERSVLRALGVGRHPTRHLPGQIPRPLRRGVPATRQAPGAGSGCRSTARRHAPPRAVDRARRTPCQNVKASCAAAQPATVLQRRRKRPPARSPPWRRCSRSGRTPTTRPSSPPGPWPPPIAATGWSASRQPPGARHTRSRGVAPRTPRRCAAASRPPRWRCSASPSTASWLSRRRASRPSTTRRG